ncbi:MAG: DUF1080 domain-containing protein [Pirellulales bacterium]|nr:DUF1080 domain-containing protein [Pirellulales bacterium]
MSSILRCGRFVFSTSGIANRRLKHARRGWALLIFLALGGALSVVVGGEWKSGIIWPAPPVVDPGPVGGPPSDAIVLFDGKNLSQWDGGENWLVRDGAAIVGKGNISTKQSFGDCQLHVEWASPKEPKGSDQSRGNSGVYLMGRYEVQILDSYQNETYADGQAGAIYKQSPPMVNACRPPGQWQTYDVIFHAPRFTPDGAVERPATITVLHNGVVIQDHFQLAGGTFWHKPPEYEPHAERLPILLQNHGAPVRFRNIWVRELVPPVDKQPIQTDTNETESKD